ncbi:hypothetical protein NQ317_014817 [Molorchus minor]|uniref:Odorant receptor n=1 Tax=Molorchus minor TaxID=1323400 RepID=A0ABQ9IWM0_9CUCU|nr:hypothetical protein NQ317_014817 [Molorchus minor]
MNKPDEIVCLTTTLNLFRAFGIFPKKGEELSPGASEYNHIDLDLMYVLSMTSGYLLFLLINIRKAAKMYVFLSDFQQFGKPTTFVKTNNIMNKAAKYHAIYLTFVVSLFALSSNMFRNERCRRNNEAYGFKEICGLITNTWLPIDIDYFPLKHIYILLQLFGVYYVYILSGTITFMVLETVVHICVRLNHVEELFVEAIDYADVKERRKKFVYACRYHSRVLKLEKELNVCFSNAMLSHMILTAAILGCATFGFIQSGSMNPLAVAIGWLNGVTVVSIGGQLLTNKSQEIGIALYNTNWYKVEPALQRDLSIVLGRCRRPMLLRASAFGIMNHATLLAKSGESKESTTTPHSNQTTSSLPVFEGDDVHFSQPGCGHSPIGQKRPPGGVKRYLHSVHRPEIPVFPFLRMLNMIVVILNPLAPCQFLERPKTTLENGEIAVISEFENKRSTGVFVYEVGRRQVGLKLLTGFRIFKNGRCAGIFVYVKKCNPPLAGGVWPCVGGTVWNRDHRIQQPRKQEIRKVGLVDIV